MSRLQSKLLREKTSQYFEKNSKKFVHSSPKASLNNPKKYKLLLTGGHAATTAISVVEELMRRDRRYLSWDISWVGPKYAMEGKRVPTLAFVELPKRGVRYYSIIAGRIQRKFTAWSLLSFLKIPLGFIHAMYLVGKIRPKVILSFGGYAGFPVVVVGWMFRIPVLIHDQTYSYNRSNKMSASFATKIALSRQESLKYYPENKSVVTGNPIMKSISQVKPKIKKNVLPVVYVTGGSTGAKSINSLILGILERLLLKYKVIHHVGLLDYKKFLKIKNELPKRLSKNYIVYKNIDPAKISAVFNQADIVISRAGANTVSEIIATKRPAILVPLTIGKWDEQKKNALYAKRYGIARVLTQEDLKPTKLFKEIEEVNREWRNIIGKVKDKKSPDRDASRKLIDLVFQLVK